MFHRHEWKYVASRSDSFRHGWETEVLSQCVRCLKYRTDRLAGKFAEAIENWERGEERARVAAALVSGTIPATDSGRIVSGGS